MIDKIHNALHHYIETLEDSTLKDGISYALLAGGKRIRPLLMLQVIEHYGLDPNKYVDVAIALELLHTYSLVHDDLPSMDDDTLRRGKPTLHIAFDEATAILVGDALLTDSFHLLSKSSILSPDQKVKMIEVLSNKTGSKGMVYGQILDIESEKQNVDINHLDLMYLHKTANLIQASFMMGAIASKAYGDVLHWESLGQALGLYFQIQDDLLEFTSTPEMLGKSKSDDKREKPTYVSIKGLEQTKSMLTLLDRSILDYQKKLHINDGSLLTTLDEIKKRKA
jgi:geranylgeranyl diphosphate synthase type II